MDDASNALDALDKQLTTPAGTVEQSFMLMLMERVDALEGKQVSAEATISELREQLGSVARLADWECCELTLEVPHPTHGGLGEGWVEAHEVAAVCEALRTADFPPRPVLEHPHSDHLMFRVLTSTDGNTLTYTVGVLGRCGWPDTMVRFRTSTVAAAFVRATGREPFAVFHTPMRPDQQARGIRIYVHDTVRRTTNA